MRETLWLQAVLGDARLKDADAERLLRLWQSVESRPHLDWRTSPRRSVWMACLSMPIDNPQSDAWQRLFRAAAEDQEQEPHAQLLLRLYLPSAVTTQTRAEWSQAITSAAQTHDLRGLSAEQTIEVAYLLLAGPGSAPDKAMVHSLLEDGDPRIGFAVMDAMAYGRMVPDFDFHAVQQRVAQASSQRYRQALFAYLFSRYSDVQSLDRYLQSVLGSPDGTIVTDTGERGLVHGAVASTRRLMMLRQRYTAAVQPNQVEAFFTSPAADANDTSYSAWLLARKHPDLYRTLLHRQSGDVGRANGAVPITDLLQRVKPWLPEDHEVRPESATTASATAEPELARLASSFVQWVPERQHPVDAENPYRRRVVQAGERIVPLLLALPRKDGNALDPNVISVLGEIGSSQAFPALLKEYQERPGKWTAISLGASMGEGDVAVLLATFGRDDAGLRALLATIYGTRWSGASGLATEQLQQDVQRSRDRLREDCRIRSRPLLG